MSIDLSILNGKSRLLFEIPLKPLQGSRFQPTGFPNLGAATFKTAQGEHLLVESAQSMANRLEMTIWDEATHDVVPAAKGISHVRVERKGMFLTDSVIESHRINSPYLLEGSDKSLLEAIKKDVGTEAEGIVDRKRLAEALLKYDIGSLLHGAFLAKKELAGGRLRVSRAISAFIEAEGVRVAASGGVKNDSVNPSGDTKKGFGNIPFSRDEYTADKITLYVNLDLAQIRGYGLGDEASRLLILLALYKLRKLVDGDLRLRTACDLALAEAVVSSSNHPSFTLPSLVEIEADLPAAIASVQTMKVTTVKYEDKIESAKESKKTGAGDSEDEDGGEEE